MGGGPSKVSQLPVFYKEYTKEDLPYDFKQGRWGYDYGTSNADKAYLYFPFRDGFTGDTWGIGLVAPTYWNKITTPKEIVDWPYLHTQYGGVRAGIKYDFTGGGFDFRLGIGKLDYSLSNGFSIGIYSLSPGLGLTPYTAIGLGIGTLVDILKTSIEFRDNPKKIAPTVGSHLIDTVLPTNFVTEFFSFFKYMLTRPSTSKGKKVDTVSEFDAALSYNSSYLRMGKVYQSLCNLDDIIASSSDPFVKGHFRQLKDAALFVSKAKALPFDVSVRDGGFLEGQFSIIKNSIKRSLKNVEKFRKDYPDWMEGKSTNNTPPDKKAVLSYMGDILYLIEKLPMSYALKKVKGKELFDNVDNNFLCLKDPKDLVKYLEEVTSFYNLIGSSSSGLFRFVKSELFDKIRTLYDATTLRTADSAIPGKSLEQILEDRSDLHFLFKWFETVVTNLGPMGEQSGGLDSVEIRKKYAIWRIVDKAKPSQKNKELVKKIIGLSVSKDVRKNLDNLSGSEELMIYKELEPYYGGLEQLKTLLSDDYNFFDALGEAVKRGWDLPGIEGGLNPLNTFSLLSDLRKYRARLEKVKSKYKTAKIKMADSLIVRYEKMIGDWAKSHKSDVKEFKDDFAADQEKGLDDFNDELDDAGDESPDVFKAIGKLGDTLHEKNIYEFDDSIDRLEALAARINYLSDFLRRDVNYNLELDEINADENAIKTISSYILEMAKCINEMKEIFGEISGRCETNFSKKTAKNVQKAVDEIKNQFGDVSKNITKAIEAARAMCIRRSSLSLLTDLNLRGRE